MTKDRKSKIRKIISSFKRWESVNKSTRQIFLMKEWQEKKFQKFKIIKITDIANQNKKRMSNNKAERTIC